jgi:WD40 repeat protein
LSHLAFSPDSRFLAAGGPGVFHLWRLGQDPDNRQSIVSESRQVTALVFSPNSDRLAVAHPSGIEVFRVEQKGRISILENALLRHHVYNGLAFRDEQQLICLSYPDVLRLEDWTDIQIWDPIGGATTVLCLRMSTEAVTLVDRHELSCLVCRHLSPNGRWVAGIPFESNYVHLYDPITGDEIGRVTRDSQERPSHTVLSPDDRTLAVVDSIGEVKLIPWAALLL